MASHDSEDYMGLFSGTAALGAGLLMASAAMAADPPDLVGTWKATGEAYAAVRLGDADDHFPEYTDPDFGTPDEAWTVVIKQQKGRAFDGVAISPHRGEEELVGVVTFDGKHLVISGKQAGVFAEVIGENKIEFCYQDQESGRAAVSCVIAAKQ